MLAQQSLHLKDFYTSYWCLQFVTTLEANIYAKIDALVNVTITNIAPGSIKVTNSVAFTSSNNAAALAGQSALASVLNSGDVSGIFGTSFGSVTVSSVALGPASNPSECLHPPYPAYHLACICSISCVWSLWYIIWQRESQQCLVCVVGHCKHPK